MRHGKPPDPNLKVIAEACGWTEVHLEYISWDGPPTQYWQGVPNTEEHKQNRILEPVPDYANDLNALHAAEQSICGNGQDWGTILCDA